MNDQGQLRVENGSIYVAMKHKRKKTREKDERIQPEGKMKGMGKRMYKLMGGRVRAKDG